MFGLHSFVTILAICGVLVTPIQASPAIAPGVGISTSISSTTSRPKITTSSQATSTVTLPTILTTRLTTTTTTSPTLSKTSVVSSPSSAQQLDPKPRIGAAVPAGTLYVTTYKTSTTTITTCSRTCTATGNNAVRVMTTPGIYTLIDTFTATATVAESRTVTIVQQPTVITQGQVTRTVSTSGQYTLTITSLSIQPTTVQNTAIVLSTVTIPGPSAINLLASSPITTITSARTSTITRPTLTITLSTSCSITSTITINAQTFTLTPGVQQLLVSEASTSSSRPAEPTTTATIRRYVTSTPPTVAPSSSKVESASTAIPTPSVVQLITSIASPTTVMVSSQTFKITRTGIVTLPCTGRLLVASTSTPLTTTLPAVQTPSTQLWTSIITDNRVYTRFSVSTTMCSSTTLTFGSQIFIVSTPTNLVVSIPTATTTSAYLSTTVLSIAVPANPTTPVSEPLTTSDNCPKDPARAALFHACAAIGLAPRFTVIVTTTVRPSSTPT